MEKLEENEKYIDYFHHIFGKFYIDPESQKSTTGWRFGIKIKKIPCEITKSFCRLVDDGIKYLWCRDCGRHYEKERNE